MREEEEVVPAGSVNQGEGLQESSEGPQSGEICWTYIMKVGEGRECFRGSALTISKRGAPA